MNSPSDSSQPKMHLQEIESGARNARARAYHCDCDSGDTHINYQLLFLFMLHRRGAQVAAASSPFSIHSCASFFVLRGSHASPGRFLRSYLCFFLRHSQFFRTRRQLSHSHCITHIKYPLFSLSPFSRSVRFRLLLRLVTASTSSALGTETKRNRKCWRGTPGNKGFGAKIDKGESIQNGAKQRLRASISPRSFQTFARRPCG